MTERKKTFIQLRSKKKKKKKIFAAFGGGKKKNPTPTSIPPENQMVRPLPMQDLWLAVSHDETN